MAPLNDTQSPVTVFTAGFDEGSDLFSYLDDAFRGTQARHQARGEQLDEGDNGFLRVTLGSHGVADVGDLSGGWQRSFTLGQAGDTSLTLRYRVAFDADLDAEDYAEVLVSLDGEMKGLDGNDYVARVSAGVDWIETTIDLGHLEAGTHSLTLGGLAHLGALEADFATVDFDAVEVEQAVSNWPPQDIELEGGSVSENAAGAAVGTLRVDDPDQDSGHQIVVDDPRFEVVGDTLKLKDGASLDFEIEPQLSVDVTVTDGAGASLTKSFDITVTDVDENAPEPTAENDLPISADFTAGTEGFSYSDDAFKDTAAADYADGAHGNDGALHVTLGGQNDDDIEGMSGGWTKSFSLAEATNVSLTFTYQATIDGDFESDETTEVLVAVDGALVGGPVASLTGDGDGGSDMSTGPQTVTLDLGVLEAGQHSLTLGGYTSKKTYNNEVAEIVFDDLQVTGTAVANHAPTAIALDNLTVDEETLGAGVGGLSVSDPDSGDSHSYSVDDDRFEVVGDRLVLKDDRSLDFETESSVDLQVTATDQDGASVTESFTIQVNDVDENGGGSGGEGGGGKGPGGLGDDFSYADDAFRGTAQPGYANGALANDGSLIVTLGGENDDDIEGISGGWSQSFTLAEAKHVTVELAYDLTMNSDFEADEYAEVLAAVDGNLVGVDGADFVVRMTGNGDGGADMGSGRQVVTLDLGNLEAGTHNLTLGGFLNKKTYNNEVAQLHFDQVDLLQSDVVIPGDDNHAPTDIEITNLVVAENAFGAGVGNVSVTDPDPQDGHTLAVDDDRFEFRGDALYLKSGQALDYEAEPVVNLTITATDGAGASFAKAFALQVADVDEGGAASPIISAGFENGTDGFVLTANAFGTSASDYASGAHAADGTLTVTLGGVDDDDIAGMSAGWTHDFELNDPHQATLTFSYRLEMADAFEPEEQVDLRILVDGQPFEMHGSTVVDSLDGNGQTSGWKTVTLDLGLLGVGPHSVTIGGYLNQKTYNDETAEIAIDDVRLEGVLVDDGNDAPTAITLTPAEVLENVAGATVGTLDAIDPNDGDTHVFQLSDNRFEVVGDQLKLKSSVELDYETEASIDIEVTAIDQGGRRVTQTLTVQVVDANDSIQDITLDNANVVENQAGAVVGTLTVVDTDAGDTHTLEVSDPRFEIIGNQLKLRDTQSLDHETESFVDLTVTATDNGGGAASKVITIGVSDVNEQPTDISLDNDEVNGNLPGAVVGTLSAADPDAGDSFTYQVSDGRFRVDGNVLRLQDGATIDAGSEPWVDLQVTATDSGGLSFQKYVQVAITEGPTIVPNLVESDFAQGAGAFTYADNVFRGATNGNYASGAYEATGGYSGGGVTVSLGGIDTNPINGMSGGWSQSFNLAEATNVTVAFRYKMDLVGGYDPDEYSEVLFALDGQLVGDNGTDHLAKMYGVGDSGGDQTTGWQTFVADLGVMSAGDHTITLGGYNNLKTFNTEQTEITFDDVVVTEAAGNRPPLDIALDGGSITEHVPGDVVGELRVDDPDYWNDHSFTISDSRFEVEGLDLKLKDGQSVNFETEQEIQLTVTAADEEGASVTRSFTVQVQDFDESNGPNAAGAEALASLTVGQTPANGSAFFVAKNGNDSWSGKYAEPLPDGSDGPFASVEKAQSALRADPNIDTVYLREGTYFLDQTLTLTEADSGIKILAYPGETPTLSGGELVTEWRDDGNGYYSAALGQRSGLSLSINGEALRVSQTGDWDPNDPLYSGWLNGNGVGGTESEQRRSIQFDAGQLDPTDIHDGMYAQIFTSQRWVDAFQKIDYVDFGNRILRLEDGPEFQGDPFWNSQGRLKVDDGSTFRIFNNSEWVHENGEFGWDWNANRLVVKTDDPDTLMSEGAVVGRLDTLVHLNGADNVTIQGLTLADTEMDKFVDADHPNDVQAAFYLSNGANNNVLAGNSFDNINTAFFLQNADNNDIIGNSITEIGGYGVQLWHGADNNSVYGNEIADIGIIHKHVGGVYGEGASSNRIAYNDIHDVPRYGVTFNSWQDPASDGFHNTIEYNTILRTNQETSDTGAIHQNGRRNLDLDLTIRYNYIEDTGGVLTDTDGNVSYRQKSSGIYLDDMANQVDIYGNFFKDAAWSDVFVHGGDDVNITNNVAIIDNEQEAAWRLEWHWVGGEGHLYNNTITNNIVYGEKSLNNYWYEWNPGEFNMSSNLVYNFAQLWSGHEQGTIKADPLFTDAANGDYSLKDGSPAGQIGFTDLPYDQMGLQGADLSGYATGQWNV